MNTQQINTLLADVPNFRGTFPANMIPKPQKIPAAYVINTGSVKKQKSGAIVVEGEHWVALILKAGGRADYFDSYGLPPTVPEIADFIANHAPGGISFSTQMLQDPVSRVCGVYCVDYLRQRLKHNVSKRNYLKSFKSDFGFNDRLVVKRVTWQLSTRLRQCKLNLKTLLS